MVLSAAFCQGGVGLSLFDAAVSILAFLTKPAHGLLLRSIHDNFGGNPITLENKGERFVSITFFLHWVRSQSMKTGGIHLSVEVTPTSLRLGLHRVSENVMMKALILKLPVICSETTSHGWVRDCPHPPLGSSLKCALGHIRRN